MKKYYYILEISENSTLSDIKKAYRKLAKKYHPDINKSANAHEKFVEISEAYEFLVNQYNGVSKKYPTASADYEGEDFKRTRQEAREKAKQQAEMRYEEFKMEHEAFRKSGMHDLVLLLTIIARIAAIPFFFFLLLLPVYIALHNEWTMIFFLFITWPFAFIIVWYAYDNKKNYFLPGKFYYTPKKIKQTFTEVNSTQQKCFYCPSKSADSKPYKINLLKLKDLKVKIGRTGQYNVNYNNKNISVLIPRSRKAFIAHTLIIFIKILSIISCVIFLDISSIVWKIIIGMSLGGGISSAFLLFARTKSNVSYLLSYGALFRVSVWIFTIALISQFSFRPFNIITSDFIHFVLFAIVLFDCVLMQFINYLFGKQASIPIVKQYPDVDQKFKEGFLAYNDITVLSVVYPLFKWIFG